MTPTRSGIPTTYAGTRFRSRLEARWAAMFDLIGWSWTYEPVDTAGYIPDFLISGESAFFIEVGPTIDLADYIDKATKPDAAVLELRRDLFVVGVSPLTMLDWDRSDNLAGGWFGEIQISDPDERAPTDPPAWYVWNTGLWGRCNTCHEIGVVHSEMSYHLRPCGHHQSGGFGKPIPGDWLNALWRRAGNDTQWTARRMSSVGDVLRAVR